MILPDAVFAMLNWVLNRNAEAARDAPVRAGEIAHILLDSFVCLETLLTTWPDDTAQLEAPDTPAPIFAARAIRTALFGTPQRPTAAPSDDDDDDDDAFTTPNDIHTPTKPIPQGILLTPGTGTTRRKRVSFGRDVVSDNGSRTSLNSVGGGRDSNIFNGDKRGLRRTRLTEILEAARKKNPVAKAKEKSEKDANDSKSAKGDQAKIETTDKVKMKVESDGQPDADNHNPNDQDDGWEEDTDETVDVTTDMYHPHSSSGKFWKSKFDGYRSRALTELDALIRYKKLAKSYAANQDTKATQLAEQLRQEQERVILMEKRITESASQIFSRRLREGAAGSGEEKDNALADEADARRLSELTAEMLTYKERVQQLELELARLMAERGDDLVERRVNGQRSDAGPGPSPGTLLELQRELRRARTQVRENEQLRRQVRRQQGELETVNRRMARFEQDNKRLAAENASLVAAKQQKQQGAQADSARLLELRTRVREIEDECRQKDIEAKMARAETEAIREESKIRDAAKGEVIQKLHAKLNETKKKLRLALQKSGGDVAPTAELLLQRRKSWAPETERRRRGNKMDGGSADNNHGYAAILADKTSLDLRRPHGRPARSRTYTTTAANVLTNKPNLARVDLVNNKFPGIGISSSLHRRQQRRRTFEAGEDDESGDGDDGLEQDELEPDELEQDELEQDELEQELGLEGGLRNNEDDVSAISILESPRRAAVLARIAKRKLKREKTLEGQGQENLWLWRHGTSRGMA